MFGNDKVHHAVELKGEKTVMVQEPKDQATEERENSRASADEHSSKGTLNKWNSKSAPGNDELKLVPRLVPRPLWGMSAQKLLKNRRIWETIQQDAFSSCHHRCSICGAESEGLHCHDEWEYDDGSSTAVLTGFKGVCPACHGAIHIARSIQLGLGKQAKEQLGRVNGMNAAEVEALVATAHAVWRERSQQRWKVKVQPELLERYPDLKLER